MSDASVSPRLKVAAAARGQPRARRGTDVVLLVAALFGVLVAVVAYPPSSLEQSLAGFLAALPHWLDPVWAFLLDLLWLAALVLAAAVLVNRRVPRPLASSGSGLAVPPRGRPAARLG